MATTSIRSSVSNSVGASPNRTTGEVSTTPRAIPRTKQEAVNAGYDASLNIARQASSRGANDGGISNSVSNLTRTPRSSNSAFSNSTPTPKNYTIGSQEGYGIYDALLNGRKVPVYPDSTYKVNPDGSVTTKDDAVWRRNLDGSVSITKDGQSYRPDVIYNPSASDAMLYPQYNEDYWSSYMQQLFDLQNQLEQRAIGAINAREEANVQNYINANRAAVERGRLQLQQEYDNAVRDYQEKMQMAAVERAINQDNQALRMAAAGDMGGLGQKQYDALTASYDQQLMQIQLDQLSLKQNIESEIAQLEAQGDFELANTLAELGQAQIDRLQEQYEYYTTLRYNTSAFIDELTTERSKQAMSDAITKLQMGILSDADIEALGVSPEDAKEVADYYRQMANIDLKMAQAGLEKTLKQLAGYSAGGGGRGSGSGAGLDAAVNPDMDTLFSGITQKGYQDLMSRLVDLDIDSEGNQYISGYKNVPLLRADGTLTSVGINSTSDGLALADGTPMREGDRILIDGAPYFYNSRTGKLEHGSQYDGSALAYNNQDSRDSVTRGLGSNYVNRIVPSNDRLLFNEQGGYKNTNGDLMGGITYVSSVPYNPYEMPSQSSVNSTVKSMLDNWR